MPDNNEQEKQHLTADAQNCGKDASYTLEYAEDGVFLNACYEEDGGMPLQPAVVSYDLQRRNIAGVDIGGPILRLRRHDERIRIANVQPEPTVDADVFVAIPRDEMSAAMVLLPPCGTGRALKAEDVLSLVRNKWGVVFGLDEEAVRKTAAEQSYYQEISIAQGKPAVKGEDGKVVLLFNTQRSYAPKIAEDGSADYKNLNIFESVKEGAAVATLTQPGEGEEGCTVKGQKIPAQRGMAAKFPKGKNVHISEDGQNLIAAKSGRVDYVVDRIEVSDVFRIPGDVDMGTGNIVFDGDVIVSGNVISGLMVEASGTVEVGGYVEASAIIAGKDIILKNGMQGMEKGRLKAGGNIVARFLEHSSVEAVGCIFSDSIVQCDVTSGDCLKMKGKWGRILGGVVRAARTITANTVGSISNELTVIELGASPEMRAQYTKLTASKDEIKSQLDKVVMMLRVIPARSDSPEHQQLLPKLTAARDQLQQQYSNAVSELEDLTNRFEELSHARLHVLKSIYPNVKISVNLCSVTTKAPSSYVTFYYRNGGIVSTSCEVRA